jgi:hypothetical protein
VTFTVFQSLEMGYLLTTTTMIVPTIHVHSQSDKGTVDFVTFMWDSMRMLASHPGALKLSIHCIGPTATERLKDLPQTKTYYVPNAENDRGMSGSTAHGACVEHALQMTDDGDIHIIVDSDTAVLAKGWDDHVRCELLDKRIGTVGTTYEDVGGFTSGGGNVQTYKGIPNVVWMALSPLHKWRDLRAMPKKSEDIPIKTEGQAKTYGLPVGYHVLRDVAWQIPEYLTSRNISYTGWKQLKPTKSAIVLKGLSDYHEEYQVIANDASVPFVVHHRGSMRHSFRGDRISQNFYAAVDAWLTKERKEAPRWVWQPNADNLDSLRSMQATRELSLTRVNDIEKMSGLVPQQATEPTPSDPPTPTANLPASFSITDGDTLVGWLKGTMNGDPVWNRYTQPVPRTINIDFMPSEVDKHLRLEGTVSDINVVLPSAPIKPHWLTVRNMTLGSVTLKTAEGRSVTTMPAGLCWQVLVDVDGVVHVT